MIEDLTIKRLTTDSLHDFLDYFDHRAFLDNKDWSRCYCQHYLNLPEENAEEQKDLNRDRACNRVAEGKMDGYLAYQGDRVLGWCAAGSSMLYPEVPESDEKIAVILCFNIDPDFRRQGLSGQILDLVLEDLKARGFEAAEAAPAKSAELGNRSYRGTLELFAKRGFEKLSDLGEDFVVVRKFLN